MPSAGTPLAATVHIHLNAVIIAGCQFGLLFNTGVIEAILLLFIYFIIVTCIYFT